ARAVVDRLALAAVLVSRLVQFTAVGLCALLDRPEPDPDLRCQPGWLRDHHADCHACDLQYRLEIPIGLVRRYTAQRPRAIRISDGAVWARHWRRPHCRDTRPSGVSYAIIV